MLLFLKYTYTGKGGGGGDTEKTLEEQMTSWGRRKRKRRRFTMASREYATTGLFVFFNLMKSKSCRVKGHPCLLGVGMFVRRRFSRLSNHSARKKKNKRKGEQQKENDPESKEKLRSKQSTATVIHVLISQCSYRKRYIFKKKTKLRYGVTLGNTLADMLANLARVARAVSI